MTALVSPGKGALDDIAAISTLLSFLLALIPMSPGLLVAGLLATAIVVVPEAGGATVVFVAVKGFAGGVTGMLAALDVAVGPIVVPVVAPVVTLVV